MYDTWDQITTYLMEKQEKTTLEAKLHLKLANEANMVRGVDYTLEHRLDCIYDDKPLGFDKDPSISIEKIKAQDPLEEIYLGDGSIKRPTYIIAKIYPDLKDQVVQLLKNYKDDFKWDYDEMPCLRLELVELKLAIKSGKKPEKQFPRRFISVVISKIKEKN